MVEFVRSLKATMRVFHSDLLLRILKNLILIKRIGKYHSELETIVNDLAQKSTGGEEATIVFPMGKVTIKLR